MATSPVVPVIRHLRNHLLPDLSGLTDGQLLEKFITRQDEAAFAALLRRHGPMVFGVCRRLLRDPHDAEDAFQATFLVLVRKAASVVPRELLPNWLYGVAYQTAVRARSANAKRHRRERQVTDMPERPSAPRDPWDDLRPLLDQELAALPDRYRAAVVLCDLEGKTRKEAARQLGLPEGTLSSRLARARALLARRLARHGVGVSGGALAAVLSQNAAWPCVPAAVLSATIRAAARFAAGTAGAGAAISARVAALTEGVLKAMLLTKLKLATAAFLAAFLVAGGWLTYGVQPGAQAQQSGRAADRPDPAEKENAPAGATQAANPPKNNADQTDLEKLQGLWENIENAQTILIRGHLMEIRDDAGKLIDRRAYRIVSDRLPKFIDCYGKNETYRGIYELNGDNLIMAFGNAGNERSVEFERNGLTTLIFLKRVHEGAAGGPKAKPKEEARKVDLRLYAVVEEVNLRTRLLSFKHVSGNQLGAAMAKDALGEKLDMESAVLKYLWDRYSHRTKLGNVLVGPEARIMAGDKVLQFADLRPGMVVSLELVAARQWGVMIVGMQVYGKKQEDKKKP
jgi:RNA polymerase sigma factor (sigma-70 family)